MTRAGMYPNSGGRGCSKPATKSRGGGLLRVVYCLRPSISERALQAGEGRLGGMDLQCGAHLLSFGAGRTRFGPSWPGGWSA